MSEPTKWTDSARAVAMLNGLDEFAADRLDKAWRSSDVDSVWTPVDSKLVEPPA